MPICYPALMRPLIAFRDHNGSPHLTCSLGTGGWGMDEESKLLTAFAIELFGFYECDRMPFRLTNTPVTFQQLMETCLRDLNFNWCIIYLEDIVIFFSNNPASHLERLEAVFQKLGQAGLKLKPSKCELFYWQITYLGYIISAQEIATDESKIETIKKWPTPTYVTEVQSFLVFRRYYGWFIPKFMQVHELTSGENAGKKKMAIMWDDRCQWSSDDQKCLCTMEPIVAYADFSRPF